jgi:pimeloyl-ACP methyl ester carboxylesterase
VDDRQTGKSTGDVSKATTQDFAADAEVSLRELRKRKDIDPARTGLIGHSEGSLIAAMVGAEDPNVDFIIMLAGPGLRGDRLLSLQREAIVRANGVNEKAGEASGALSDLLTEAVLHSPDSSVQLQQALQAFASWKKHTDTAIVSRMGLQDDRQAEHFIRLQLKTMRNPWLLYFLQTDPAVYLRRLRCRVLALNGSKDVQVVPDANLAAIDSALKQSRAKSYTLEKLPGLNHLFQHCKACTASEYAQLEETFAPEALQRMGDWLDKNVKP